MSIAIIIANAAASLFAGLLLFGIFQNDQERWGTLLTASVNTFGAIAIVWMVYRMWAS